MHHVYMEDDPNKPNELLDEEWIARFKAKVPHGRARPLARELNVAESTIARLKQGIGALQLAWEASIKVGIMPPYRKCFPEPYRSFLENLEKTIEAGKGPVPSEASVPVPIEPAPREERGVGVAVRRRRKKHGHG